MIDFWKEVDGLLPTLGKLPHVIVVPGKVRWSLKAILHVLSTGLGEIIIYLAQGN